jgi:cytoskeletal protein CcmA (bactofilin family)
MLPRVYHSKGMQADFAGACRWAGCFRARGRFWRAREAVRTDSRVAGHGARHENLYIMDAIMNNSGSSKNVLSSDVEIKGNLKFSGELTFEGKLDGEIQTEGTLNLGESAAVNGNIAAQTVIVRGKVNGNITAKDKVEIKSKAELFGDIRASKLVIEEGVTYVGKTEVNPNKVAPTPLPRVTEPPKAPTPELAGRPGR